MYPMRRVNLDTCAWEDTKLSENRLLEANDLFLNGVLDELRLVVDIEFAHQVEFVGLDGLYAEFEGAGDLFDGFAFGQHFENLALAFRERAETGLAGRSAALHRLAHRVVHQHHGFGHQRLYVLVGPPPCIPEPHSQDVLKAHADTGAKHQRGPARTLAEARACRSHSCLTRYWGPRAT